MPESKPSAQPEYDPTYLNSLREAYVIVALFAVFCIWSIFVCYNYGYMSPGEQRSEISTTMGIPSWAFWGIGLPWVAVDIVAVWFCFFFMKADQLGEEQEADLQGGEEVGSE